MGRPSVKKHLVAEHVFDTCHRFAPLNMTTTCSTVPTLSWVESQCWFGECETDPPTAGSPARWWRGRQLFLRLLTEPSCQHFEVNNLNLSCQQFEVILPTICIFQPKVICQSLNDRRWSNLMGGNIVEAEEGVWWRHTDHKQMINTNINRTILQLCNSPLQYFHINIFVTLEYLDKY